MEHVAPGQWDEPRAVEVSGDEIKSLTNNRHGLPVDLLIAEVVCTFRQALPKASFPIGGFPRAQPWCPRAEMATACGHFERDHRKRSTSTREPTTEEEREAPEHERASPTQQA